MVIFKYLFYLGFSFLLVMGVREIFGKLFFEEFYFVLNLIFYALLLLTNLHYQYWKLNKVLSDTFEKLAEIEKRRKEHPYLGGIFTQN